jgi:hypothetical protein
MTQDRKRIETTGPLNVIAGGPTQQVEEEYLRFTIGRGETQLAVILTESISGDTLLANR